MMGQWGQPMAGLVWGGITVKGTLCEVMGLVLPKPDSKGAMQRIRGWWVEEHGLTGTLP